jgi:hypothetical protein
MNEIPIRRSQLVAPFGVGSMMTSAEGVTMMMAGLDFWLQDDAHSISRREFEIADEWRLAKELLVEKFVMPPDFRDQKDHSLNNKLTVPAFRFPTWGFCPRCYRMNQQTPFERRNFRCSSCLASTNGSTRRPVKTVQVAFIALCREGHIQDFPFRDWVHREANSSCEGEMRLSLSGNTLASQSVECTCGKKRSFNRILGREGEDGNRSYLSQNLNAEGEYLCEGWRPWLGEQTPSGCGQQLFGGITGSVNNYYAHVQSAIFLPQTVEGISQELTDFFETNEFQQFLAVAKSLDIDSMIQMMDFNGVTRAITPLLHGAELKTSLQAYLNRSNHGENTEQNEDKSLKDNEYAFLQSNESLDTRNLATRRHKTELYAPHSLSHLIDGVVAVDKLRETRALVGFDRLQPRSDRTLPELKGMMRRSGVVRDWLPAYEVFGEGIFLSLNDYILGEWGKRPEIQGRVRHLLENPVASERFGNTNDATFVPRTLAVHTLGHLLINQMIFSSGYSAASLRERVYVTPGTKDKPGGNGLLIYTASGDVEGSLGGLVRLSTPGRLEVMIDAALETANFCSADPVCMEVGTHGQGPDSLNLAACHNCTLIPETSCEMFNVYLDRGLVVGTIEEPGLGITAH